MGGVSKGRFITFEGGEGAGKTTQLALLANALKKKGIDVIVTREPGGSTGAEQIRALLVDGDANRWDGLTEALLNFAARRDHLMKTIWPALERGVWVLCDRFADSTVAYQGYGHGLKLDAINVLYRVTVGDFVPDLTLILDLPVEEGLARAMARGNGEDRYEKMENGFHSRLRQGFLTIAADNPERCVVIPAANDVPFVANAILKSVEERFSLEETAS